MEKISEVCNQIYHDMSLIGQEILFVALEMVDLRTTKNCRLVCGKWLRISTPLLFRFVCHVKDSKGLGHIIAEGSLSVHIRHISLELGSTVHLPWLLAQHTILALWIPRPTVGVIRQHSREKIITTLTDMSSERSGSILPALKEVQLITAEALLHPITLFASLKKLEIDLEIVQLEAGTTWLHLEDLRLRGILNISGLESFVARHKHLRHLHLAAVSILRPLDSEPGLIHKLLRFALETRLRSDLVSSIMGHVTKHASGHERSLFQCLYIRLDKVATKKTVEDLRRKIIEGYGEIMRLDLDKYCEELGRMHIFGALAASQLELSVSIEAFWEDQLAIKGMTSTVKSEDGQWVNNKVDEIPRIFYGFTKRTR